MVHRLFAGIIVHLGPHLLTILSRVLALRNMCYNITSLIMKYLLVTSCEEKDFTNSVSEQA